MKENDDYKNIVKEDIKYLRFPIVSIKNNFNNIFDLGVLERNSYVFIVLGNTELGYEDQKYYCKYINSEDLFNLTNSEIYEAIIHTANLYHNNTPFYNEIVLITLGDKVLLNDFMYSLNQVFVKNDIKIQNSIIDEYSNIENQHNKNIEFLSENICKNLINKQKSIKSIQSSEYFYLKQNDNNITIDAKGYINDNGSFTILKDSKKSNLGLRGLYDNNLSLKQRDLTLVNRQNNLLTNIILNNPSSAAYFITGRYNNGWHLWKNKDGLSIYDIYVENKML